MDLVFIMDPIQGIDINADSTFAMMRAGQARGHRLLYAEPRDLEQVDDVPWLLVRPIEVRQVPGDHFSLGAPFRMNLNQAGAVFMRQDPPFSIEYLISTYILDRIDRSRVVLVNDPQGLRDSNEKLFALEFPSLTPRTLISRSPARIREFLEEQAEIVVKPLVNAGGSGVLHLRRGEKNVRAILELLTDNGRVAIEAQAYLERVTEGDRRVLLIGGDPVGVINRRPQPGELRSNMHVGGTAEPAQLSPRDREICAALKPELLRRGLAFVGIDVIDGRLTEINVTSPTGMQELDRFEGVCVEDTMIEWVERRSRELKG